MGLEEEQILTLVDDGAGGPLSYNTEYPHIDSLFKREVDGPMKGAIRIGEWTCPEFQYLANLKWRWTEKVDGANIRIIFDPTVDEEVDRLQIRGRTDRASMPGPLGQKLERIFKTPWMRQQLADQFDHGVVLYGEGYGAGIQKVGVKYSPVPDFILFDVRVGNWWLEWDAVIEIAEALEIRSVPTLGLGTLDQAIAFTKDGFGSMLGEAEAEGLVLRPMVSLRKRNGQRLIAKTKTKDWEPLR